MANFLVISAADDGAGSLRQALSDAEENEGADTISFAPSLRGQTIQLVDTLQITSGAVTIDGDVDGDGSPDITISGDQDDNGADAGDVQTLLTVALGTDVTLNALHFTGAFYAGPTSYSAFVGIRNAGTLTITDSVLSDMVAIGSDGSTGSAFYVSGGDGVAGVFNTGSLTISDTLFDSLRATGGDGAIFGGTVFGSGGQATAGIRNVGVLEASGIGLNNLFIQDGGGTAPGYGGTAVAGIHELGVGTITNVTGPVAVFGTTHDYGTGSNGSHFVGGNPVTGVTTVTVPDMSAGNDTVSVAISGTFFGQAGDDHITHISGDALIRGGGGNDYIRTNAAGTAYGGSGNDTIIKSLVGNNSISDGGSGNDLLDIREDPGLGILLNMETGVGGYNFGDGPFAYSFTARNFENFIGIDHANYSDNVTGTTGANIISGLAGNDTLLGMNGDDHLFGGEGDDTLRGGNDHDILRGDAGFDSLFGDNGNDLLFGGTENDTLRGGNNHDRLFGQGDNDMLFGDRGNDRLFGGDGDDTLRGGKGNDRMRGGDGEDIFAFAKREGKKNVVVDYVDGEDRFDLSGFNFKNKKQVLKKIKEVGSANNDVAQFTHQGTKFKIMGADKSDIDAGDILI